MKYFHNIKISAFSPQTESKELEEKLLKFLPDSIVKDINDKKLEIELERLAGDNPIDSYSLYLKRNRHCNEFMKVLVAKLIEKYKEHEHKEGFESAKDTVISRLVKRIDEKCRVYIRIDKKDFLDDVFTLTYSGNCIHIKVTMASYPKSAENSEKLITEFVNSLEK